MRYFQSSPVLKILLRRDIAVVINEGQKYLKIDLLWHGCQIGPIDIYNREGPRQGMER